MIDHRKIDTEEDLLDARSNISACDQAADLMVGCETWGILYAPGDQRGQMTRWPDGGGAVCLGGESEWGTWREDNREQVLICNELDGKQIIYDQAGQIIKQDAEVNKQRGRQYADN